MKLSDATQLIKATLLQLETVIGEPVFDEWVLVLRASSDWKLLHYGGTRKEEFIAEFRTDVAALRETLINEKPFIGDFAFSHDGHGTGFDAHICVGESLFLLLNNTRKNTAEITCNPKWKQAQIHFSTLVEAFIADPLTRA